MRAVRPQQPLPKELDAEDFFYLELDDFTQIVAPNQTHPFVFLQQNSIADYAVEYGAAFVIDPKNPNNAPEINPAPAPVINTAEIEVEQNPVLTELALIKEVNAKSIQNKALINRFFHNVMMHFICIYLDPKLPVLEQIDACEKAIKQGNTRNVIQLLQKNRHELVNSIHFTEKKVFVNAPNGDNMSGAITYKGEGTVEEDIAAKSDFYLCLLINEATDSYQRKHLVELLGAIKKMLTTRKPLLNTKEECLNHAKTWLNLTYKTDDKGYHISPGTIHEHPVVFFIADKHIPTLNQLPRFDDFSPDFMNMRKNFLAHCRVATVLDALAEDHRPQTLFLKVIGLQKNERPVSFTEIMDQVEVKMAKYAFEYPLKNSNNTPELVMPLLGCGAFGGKPADFCAAINKNPKQFTRHGQLTLFLRHDTILTCIRLLAPVIPQLKTEFNIPFDTIKAWWNSLQAKAVAGNATVHKELILMNMVITHNQQIFPRQVVQDFCRAELQRLYSSKSESNNVGKLRALEQICSNLLGEQYNFSAVMKSQLLTVIKDSLSLYEGKISIFSKLSKKPDGLNQLIKFQSDLAKKPLVSYMDIHHTLSILLKKCDAYNGKFMDWDYDPTPLEFCFMNLKNELTELNSLLCKQALQLDKQTMEKREYIVHGFFNSFITPVQANINHNISQHLNAIDVASMTCTSKALTKF